MQALLLAGGKGTRLKPLTDFVNKHELVVGGKSLLEHSLINIISSGIESIHISYSDNYSSEYFVPDLINKYTKLYPHITLYGKVTISKGLAAELVQAEDFLKDDFFTVVFGDVLFEKKEQFKTYLTKFQEGEVEGMVLLGKAVNPAQHATPIFDGETLIKIVEKCPNPPCDDVVTTWDIFPHIAISYAKEITPSKRGELELSDVRNIVLAKHKVGYSFVDGWWLDAGTPYDLVRAQQYLLNKQ